MPLPPLLPSPPRPPQAPTDRRLTPVELASRHEHGLCFTCDEKFHRGHHCASRVHLLIAEDEEPANPLGSNTKQLDPKLATPVSKEPDPKPTPDPNPNTTPDPEPAQTPLRVMFFHHGRFVELPGENATTWGLLLQH